MITKNTRKVPVTANSAVTSSAKRNVVNTSSVKLTPAKQVFCNQLIRNMKKLSPVTAATNTSNIGTKPTFLEVLPLFVQKLLVLDVFGSVAMNSRQQLIPYFKVVADTTKGETARGTIMNSPFVNRQGMDVNFTGRVVKNEEVASPYDNGYYYLAYTPALPGSITVHVTLNGVTTPYTDNGSGDILDASGATVGNIDYTSGSVNLKDLLGAAKGATCKATYQYDNETVGPNEVGEHGAKMGTLSLQLDEINLVAEAHELACYWSIYSAFVAKQEYGTDLGTMAKEAALSEITAEINTDAFNKLLRAAAYRPQFNWDASPVLTGSVVPSDYLNMFKLKLEQAASSVYQATRLARPNRLIVGTNVASYMAMMNGYTADNSDDNVGPYHAGRFNNFEVYCDPNYDANTWVMCCKNQDVRRNSALFGEYMPVVSTDEIGLANLSNQQGYATMYTSQVINPQTVVSGKILGTF